MGRRRYIYPYSYLLMIVEYVEWRDVRRGSSSSPCFGYEGIMNFAGRFYGMRKTTVERVLRRLVEDRYIKRVLDYPAIFCIDYGDVLPLLGRALGRQPAEILSIVKTRARQMEGSRIHGKG